MFSRENLDDSYTLDNYIHFIKKKSVEEQEFSEDFEHNHIQKMEYFAHRKRKNSTQLSIFSWLVKDKLAQNSLLISLDKELILKIYSYLRISQIVIISQVGSYFFSCYKYLWMNKNFFQKFQTDKFTSQQLNKVIEKSKLGHIKQLKQIYMGKNIKKNRQKIKMRLTDGASSSNSMLEVFSISPKIKNGIVFIIDSHLQNILNSSYKGLKCIQLNRCAYVRNIQSISRCLQLEKFAITYNEFVTTQNLIPIFKRCLKLSKIEISECKNLDQNIFRQLKNAQNLRSLSLKFFKQSFGSLHMLSNCQNLEYLNINDSLINDNQFMNSLLQLRSLKFLSIQGCALLSDISFDFLDKFLDKPSCQLKQILIARIVENLIENLQKESLQRLILNNLSLEIQSLISKKLLYKQYSLSNHQLMIIPA